METNRGFSFPLGWLPSRRGGLAEAEPGSGPWLEVGAARVTAGWPWWVGPIGHTSALWSVGGQSGRPSLPVRVIVESLDAVALKGPNSCDTRSCAPVSRDFWGSCPRQTGGSSAAS